MYRDIFNSDKGICKLISYFVLKSAFYVRFILDRIFFSLN